MKTVPDRHWLAVDAATCAERLLGVTLVRTLPSGERLAGVIVETEAYLGAHDRASHTYAGRRTARNEAMYARAGTAYVYFTYGMHYCMNVVCGDEGEGAAVLVRAIEPVEGLESMRRLRSGKMGASRLRDTDLCSGPAKLCRALAIDRALNGADLLSDDPGAPLRLEADEARVREARMAGVERSPRIGIVSAGEEWAAAPLRFTVSGSPFLSRPAGGAARSRTGGAGGL